MRKVSLQHFLSRDLILFNILIKVTAYLLKYEKGRGRARVREK